MIRMTGTTIVGHKIILVFPTGAHSSIIGTRVEDDSGRNEEGTERQYDRLCEQVIIPFGLVLSIGTASQSGTAHSQEGGPVPAQLL